MLTDEHRFWMFLSGLCGGTSFGFGFASGYLVAAGTYWLAVAMGVLATVSWIVSLIARGIAGTSFERNGTSERTRDG